MRRDFESPGLWFDSAEQGPCRVCHRTSGDAFENGRPPPKFGPEAAPGFTRPPWESF